MNMRSKLLAGLPILVLGLPFAGAAAAEECYTELPRCVERITVEPKEISLRNGCDFHVAVKVEVIDGLGSGVSSLNANGGVYTLDERSLIKSSSADPYYSSDLRCCTGKLNHECVEQGRYPGPI